MALPVLLLLLVLRIPGFVQISGKDIPLFFIECL
jgi:hypothetical protein